MNATIAKFGHPATLVAEYRHWLVLLRPVQATLGALVLVHRGEQTSLARIGAAAFAEMEQAVGDIEATLGRAFAFDKINYLLLQMVDPHVHFHVLPRYAAVRSFGGQDFADPGWPGPPDLARGAALAAETRDALLAALRRDWPRTAPA